MWALLSSWFRRLLLFTVVVPLIGWALGKAGDILEARGGESSLTRGLRKARAYTQDPRLRRRRRFL